MCLILLAWQVNPELPLVLAANRDEAYDRPAEPAHFWSEDEHVCAGRDLRAGGTWLGVTRSGRIAAVTNYRERPRTVAAPRSRGEITAGYLLSDVAPRAWLESVAGRAHEYGPFSAILGDRDALWCYSNRGGGGIERIAPGVHGLSNGLIDAPWPKVVSGRRRLARILEGECGDLASALFAFLLDRTGAPDADLPDTGVGIQRERELSPPFIAGEQYGTRASTVVLIDRHGAVAFVERSFGPRGTVLGLIEHRFILDRRPTGARIPAIG